MVKIFMFSYFYPNSFIVRLIEIKLVNRGSLFKMLSKTYIDTWFTKGVECRT